MPSIVNSMRNGLNGMTPENAKQAFSGAFVTRGKTNFKLSHYSMRRFLIVLAVVLVIALSACSSGTEFTHWHGEDNNFSTDLVGTWLFHGEPYYILEANGTGMMSVVAINWIAHDGILAVCNTPRICRGNCRAPQRWEYEISGNELTLTNPVISRIAFTYTRQ